MRPRERRRFDDLLEAILAELPEELHLMLEEVPLVVEDEPSGAMLRELAAEGMGPMGPDELCGLHSGRMRTEQSVEDSGVMPSQITLFRRGIVAEAGGWAEAGADERVAEQIRITLLHELGHEFGLNEDDLDRLGFA